MFSFLRSSHIPLTQWPVYKLYKERSQLVSNVVDQTYQELLNQYEGNLHDLLAKTAYKERIRINIEPWKVDPPDQSIFWKRIQNKLRKQISAQDKEQSARLNKKILNSVLKNYTQEIAGTFHLATFKFVRVALTILFSSLYNSVNAWNIWKVKKGFEGLQQKFKFYGNIEEIKKLMDQGVVVLVPTHSSNLDSILIGYMCDQCMEWPSFSYGAGLNLYNSGGAAYFMNRLGAYRVDRRKKNTVYLANLTNFSRITLEKGVNTIFFPGGTRSRSGEVETKLKMGLLGSAVEAQRNLVLQNIPSTIIIVPLVVNMPCVLEAYGLIEDYLNKKGKEKYFKGRRNWATLGNRMKLIRNIIRRESHVIFSFGEPMDVIGNPIYKDENGYKIQNIDKIGQYFTGDHNQAEINVQREMEYTRILAERIGESYLKYNVIIPSHVFAFICFHIFSSAQQQVDMYQWINLPSADYGFPFKELEQCLEEFIPHLKDKMFQKEFIVEERILKLSAKEILQVGINELGVFHAIAPVSIEGDQIFWNDFRVMYFYSNRLRKYLLEDVIRWNKYQITVQD